MIPMITSYGLDYILKDYWNGLKWASLKLPDHATYYVKYCYVLLTETVSVAAINLPSVDSSISNTKYSLQTLKIVPQVPCKCQVAWCLQSVISYYEIAIPLVHISGTTCIQPCFARTKTRWWGLYSYCIHVSSLKIWYMVHGTCPNNIQFCAWGVDIQSVWTNGIFMQGHSQYMNSNCELVSMLPLTQVWLMQTCRMSAPQAQNGMLLGHAQYTILSWTPHSVGTPQLDSHSLSRPNLVEFRTPLDHKSESHHSAFGM